MMKELVFDVKRGYGRLVDEETHTEFTVLKAGDLYNLGLRRYGGYLFFVVENKKRLSTIQKYLNENHYNVVIKEV